ncbi:MAG: hypothetical protein H0S80_11560 [Desulfovibrionaceae bacterium]|nr:hypothetical protein [Desulfovibrionaceae bacterium]
MTRNDASCVHVVHCVDTEGPLHESLEATFERLRDAFGVTLAPSRATLKQIQRRELDPNGWEEAAARMVAPAQLAYLDTWEKIDRSLDMVFSPQFRDPLRDSFGNPYVCNWFCMDHVGFEANPRRRAFGYHVVFEHYRTRLNSAPHTGDDIYFHYHPVPISRQANHRATACFANSDTLYQILARRVIDHGWFPCANRPGFNATRPDSHWFLEQHIPFDFANQAMHAADRSQADRATGRFVDWRRAPVGWTPYHPDKDDYQKPGECRRWIARCLDQAEIDRAFSQAARGEPVILAYADHDHRTIPPDMEHAHAMLLDAAARHPGVPFQYCTARDAFRRAMNLSEEDGVTFGCRWQGPVLHVKADAPTFGPQPFLALKRTDGAYFTDNMDCDTPHREWSYTFDAETIPLKDVSRVGLAACSPGGSVTVTVINPADGSVEQNRI